MDLPAPSKNIYDLFVKFASVPNRKSFFRIVAELFYLLITQQKIPYHYFSRYLFLKGRTNLNDYIPNQRLHAMKSVFNEEKIAPIVDNKLFFDFFYGRFGIPVPKILIYNHGNMFVENEFLFRINNLSEFKTKLQELITKSGKGSLFAKPAYGSFGGKNIYKVTPQFILENPERINELYQKAIQSGFLFQETISQHAVLDRINPGCLSIVRFDTFIGKNEKVEIISAYLRTSVEGSFVDNFGSCEVPVNIETGKLKKEGYLTFSRYGGKVLHQHPATGTRFDGFSLPDFHQAKEIVTRVAGLVPGLRLIGWDIAFSVEGPVLIEGNYDYDLTGNDLTEGGFKNNHVFRKILKELKQNKC